MVEHAYRITDPLTLRALAHPMRQRIMMELTVRVSARAADLAEIIAEPANAVSYHLRSLAKAHLIVEAPELARDSRDRVWRVTHPEGLSIDSDGDDEVGELFNKEYLAWIRALVTETLPKDPRATRAQYTGGALLTKAESKKMFGEVTEVLERWRKHGMDGEAAASQSPDRVFHYLMAFVGNRNTTSFTDADARAREEQASSLPTETGI